MSAPDGKAGRRAARGAARIPCPLRERALAAPESPAIIEVRCLISYGELDRRVAAAARSLAALGLVGGARVALYLPKGADYITLVLALIRAGGVACPLSTRLPPRGVVPLLRRAGCRAVISGETIPGAANADPLPPEALLGGEPAHDGPLAGERSSAGTLELGSPATVVFTSGSTGEPKAALHTLANHYYSARGSSANIPLAPHHRWLHSLPLYHVGGLSILFRCFFAGAAVALPDPEDAPGEALARTGATHVSLVGSQLARLLREGGLGGARLEAILVGGGPMPVPLLWEAARRGLPVHASYGLTEMSSQVTTTRRGASREELATSGLPLAHRELKISARGEILVRGETLFAGYLADGGGVDLPLDAEGWFHTGDLGDLDAHGRVLVVGRVDNVFISGGENVQPEEIERALCHLEGIEEAVVVPVPDARFGQRPVAFVRTAGRPVQPERVVRELETSLERFKIPISVHGWPEGAEGMKVDRAALRERARRLREP